MAREKVGFVQLDLKVGQMRTVVWFLCGFRNFPNISSVILLKKRTERRNFGQLQLNNTSLASQRHLANTRMTCVERL